MEDLEVKSPEVVEKELLQQKQEETQKADFPPEEIAAMMFSVYLPRYKMLLQKLSNKALRRAMTALVEYPLNEKDYKPGSNEEREVFALGDKLLQAKWMMIQTTLMNHPLEEPQSEQTTNEESNTTMSENLENQTDGQ